jgi:hypothetical protein
MAKLDELELLYLHLQSMRNFTNLKDRLAGAATNEAAAVPAADDGEDQAAAE